MPEDRCSNTCALPFLSCSNSKKKPRASEAFLNVAAVLALQLFRLLYPLVAHDAIGKRIDVIRDPLDILL